MLMQISEPGQATTPRQQRRAIGIDLGTTNSLVATVREGKPEALPDQQGDQLLPSVVYYGSDQTVVGREACRLACDDPANAIDSVKRHMGRRADSGEDQLLSWSLESDEHGRPVIMTAQGRKTPEQVSASILRALRERAEKSLGGDLYGAVITVPAYFDDAQRLATKQAARLAGLCVLRLVNEPTAAAIAYGPDRRTDRKAGQDGDVVVVYDLGGGTFDLSVLRLNDGIFEVLATRGDTALGGGDFDQAIVRWIATQAGFEPSELSAVQQRELLDCARAGKERLTDCHQTELLFGNWQGVLSRTELNDLIDPLLDRTVDCFRQAVRDAGLSFAELAEVVMVGGATRVPRVCERIAELCGIPPLTDIDPDRVVALGAAIQADMLACQSSTEGPLLLDVTPLSLGLETMGGLMEKIIYRNTTIPVARAQEFTTGQDGQTRMVIHVLQGDRDLVDDNRSLARFVFADIPPMPAGMARIQVTFEIDADGLLNVTAIEQNSGAATSVEVQPSSGLSEQTIRQMLESSFAAAEEDKQARILRERKVEAQRIVEAVETALKVDGDSLLSASEYEQLGAQAAGLAETAQSDDADSIARQTEALTDASEEFARRRMSAEIKAALQGRSVDDLASSASSGSLSS